MGLFSKKRRTNEFPVVFYEGNLPDFTTNTPCDLSIHEAGITFHRIKPDVTVNLKKESLLEMEVYIKESDFMLKYHGHAVSTTKAKGIEKMYFVLNYQRGETVEKIAFWVTAFEFRKINAAWAALVKDRPPVVYDL